VGDEELGCRWASLGGVGALFKSENLNEFWAVQEKMGQGESLSQGTMLES
jgi:hypothetical protein